MTETGASANDAELTQLVPLRSGLGFQQAQMLKANLEGAGIPAFLSNEDAGDLKFGGVTDILVRANRWKEAEVQIGKISLMPAPPQHFEDAACEHCGSSRIHPFVGAVPTFIPMVKLSAVQEDGWFHCLECDSYWRNERKRFSSLPVAFLWSITLGAVALAAYSLIQWLRWL